MVLQSRSPQLQPLALVVAAPMTKSAHRAQCAFTAVGEDWLNMTGAGTIRGCLTRAAL
jgi:hypothetical protein